MSAIDLYCKIARDYADHCMKKGSVADIHNIYYINESNLKLRARIFEDDLQDFSRSKRNLNIGTGIGLFEKIAANEGFTFDTADVIDDPQSKLGGQQEVYNFFKQRARIELTYRTTPLFAEDSPYKLVDCPDKKYDRVFLSRFVPITHSLVEDIEYDRYTQIMFDFFDELSRVSNGVVIPATDNLSARGLGALKRYYNIETTSTGSKLCTPKSSRS